MNYKICLYALFLFLGIFVMSGINFEHIMKKNKVLEAKMLVMISSIIISYILTNFVWDFLRL